MSMQRNLEKVMTAAILALLASLVAMVTLAGTQGLADAAAAPEPQGTPAHEELGLTVEPLTPELAERLGYEDGRGVVVSEVAPGSPADDTALQPGDLIREFGRKPVAGVEDLARAAEALSGGDSAAMLVQRGEYTFYTVIELPA